MRVNRPQVAVIGTGIAGLTAAHLLHREHELTVFEADDRVGGHSNTLRVADPRGELRIDTGFIVHNDRNYPHFRALLAELGVATQEAEMGMSITTGDGRFEFANTARGLFAQRSNLLRPRFWRLIADQLRFNREVRPLAGRLDTPTVGEFLRDSGYSKWFIERAVGPEVSAVWSAKAGALMDFPLGFLAEFLANHGQLELTRRPRWRTINGGARAYIERLARPFADRIRLRAPVRRIERTDAGLEVSADGWEPELFDHVVCAAHSDQTLAMLAEPTAAEREVLGAIRYHANDAVLHTDASLMPKRKRAWASWNFHLGGDSDRPTAVTYWMNNLQRFDAEHDYFVTLNRTDDIDPAAVLETMTYSHPQITHRSVAAQRRWAQISGPGGLHYCGSYWRWGFHEDGCWSAVRACERLLAGEFLPARRPQLELAA